MRLQNNHPQSPVPKGNRRPKTQSRSSVHHFARNSCFTLSTLALITLNLVACSRGGDLGTGFSISIEPPRGTQIQTIGSTTLSSVSAYADDDPAHVIINVSGPGMSKIVYTWDREDSDGNLQSFPTQIEFTETQYPNLKGSDRLIQYLAVYETELNDTDGYSIVYGDNFRSLANLGSGATTVNLNATEIGNSGAEVQVSGQYVTATVAAGGTNRTGIGPTSKIEWQMKPPTGAPAISILEFEMFNGWFNFFLLPGIETQFIRKDTGAILAGLSVEALEAQLRGGSTQEKSRLGKLTMPPTYFGKFHYGNGTSNYYFEEVDGGEALIGFMGPKAQELTNAETCFASNQIAATNTHLFSDANSDSPLAITAERAPQTEANQVYWESLDSAGSCSSTNQPSANLILVKTEFLKFGIHAPAGFTGPIANGQASNSTPLYSSCDEFGVFNYHGPVGVCQDNNQLKMVWSFAPRALGGVAPIEGVHVFYGTRKNCAVTDANCDNYDDSLRDKNSEGYACAEFIKAPAKFGLNYVGKRKLPAPNTTINGQRVDSLTLNQVTIPTDSYPFAILCPYRGATVFNSGAESHEVVYPYP